MFLGIRKKNIAVHFRLITYSSLLVIFLLLIASIPTANATGISVKKINFSDFGTNAQIQTAGASSTTTSQLTIPTGEPNATWRTLLQTPEFNFNAIGATWQGTDLTEDNIKISAYLLSATGQTQTRILTPIGDDLKERLVANNFASKSIVVNSTPATFYLEVTLSRLAENTELTPQLDEINFIYFNTDNVFSPQNLQAQQVNATVAATTATAVGKLNIISRATWGADEAWRQNSAGTEIWPTTYVDPQIFITHHTAGTDGGTDPSATIRAIYYWHAVVLGWGDIGYNYLIDPQGNIYEGRYGGDGVVAGHTFNEAKNINYNEGSVGIALLGCFEETPGACYSQQEITSQMKDALTQLVAAKAAQFNIDPSETITFIDAIVPRLVGHRDLDATYCPGSLVLNSFTALRTDVMDNYEQLLTKPWAAKLKSWSVSLAPTKQNTEASPTVEPLAKNNLEINKVYQVTVSYKNKGSNTWTAGETFLKIYGASGERASSLAHVSWSDSLGRIVLNEASVEPGATGSFTFLIQAPSRKSQRQLVTRMVTSGHNTVNSRQSTEFFFANPEKGELTSHDWPLAMLKNHVQTVNLTFTNTGTITWDDHYVLTLNGQIVATIPAEVAPEQTVTLSFELQAPPVSPAGDRVQYYLLRLEKKQGKNKGRAFVAGTRTVLVTRID